MEGEECDERTLSTPSHIRVTECSEVRSSPYD